jgi:hypothetical protein
MAIRFISKATVKNKLPRSSNIWDGTAVYNPFTLVGNYDALATVTVPSGGLSTITFAGIPQTGYTHLQLRWMSKNTSADYSIRGQFNNDTAANYSYHGLYGTGATAAAYSGVSQTYMAFGQGADTTASVFGVGVVDILDYANTNKYKTTRALSGWNANTTTGTVQLDSSSWRSTSAVNTIYLTSFAGNFAQYSQFALYGVKA